MLRIEKAPIEVMRLMRMAASIETRSPLPGYRSLIEPRLSRPLPRWRLHLDVNAKRVSLDAALLIGWRSFLFDAESALAIDVSKRSHRQAISGVSRGRSVEAMIAALVTAERAIGENDIEARIVSAPLVQFRGIWLVGEMWNGIIEIPSTAEREGVFESRADIERALLERCARLYRMSE